MVRAEVRKRIEVKDADAFGREEGIIPHALKIAAHHDVMPRQQQAEVFNRMQHVVLLTKLAGRIRIARKRGVIVRKKLSQSCDAGQQRVWT